MKRPDRTHLKESIRAATTKALEHHTDQKLLVELYGERPEDDGQSLHGGFRNRVVPLARYEEASQ